MAVARYSLGLRRLARSVDSFDRQQKAMRDPNGHASTVKFGVARSQPRSSEFERNIAEGVDLDLALWIREVKRVVAAAVARWETQKGFCR